MGQYIFYIAIVICNIYCELKLQIFFFVDIDHVTISTNREDSDAVTSSMMQSIDGKTVTQGYMDDVTISTISTITTNHKSNTMEPTDSTVQPTDSTVQYPHKHIDEDMYGSSKTVFSVKCYRWKNKAQRKVTHIDIAKVENGSQEKA